MRRHRGRVYRYYVARRKPSKTPQRTGSAPFQHLYYIPIVFAAITVPPYGGAVAAVVAVMLYHAGNPRLLTFMYAEADVVQIALFLAIVTARLAHAASAGGVSRVAWTPVRRFHAADRALYAARAAGRNRVSVAS